MNASPLILRSIVLAIWGMGCVNSSKTVPLNSRGVAESISQIPVASERLADDRFYEIGNLRVMGSSTYQIESTLQQAIASKDSGESAPVILFFGTRDESFLRTQVSDIHRAVLPLLNRQLGNSDLKIVHPDPGSQTLYLMVEITHLAFGVEAGPKQSNGLPLGMCSADWKVKLRQTENGQPLFAKRFSVQLPRPVSEGINTLDALYSQIATKTQAWLGEWDRRELK